MSRLSQGVRRLALLAVAALCFANVVAFFAVGGLLGGAAGNGKVEGGRYFLGNHGAYTEVGEAVFDYSLWHGRSIFVTNLIGGLASLGWYRMKTAA